MSNTTHSLSARSYVIVTLVAAVIGAIASLVAPILVPGPPMPTVPGQFGEWETRNADTVYQAETSGFVAAYTGGEDSLLMPRNLLIHTGTSQGDMEVCSRGGRYEGALCPVGRGDYWRVEVRRRVGEGYDPSTVKVKWLPVVAPPS